MFTVLDQDVLTLANIDLSNNVSDNNTNIGESKEEELPLNLNTVSDGKVNEENDINTSMEKACKVARSSLLFARCSLLFARCLLLFTCCSTRNSEGFCFSKSKQKVLHINLYK